MKVVTLKYFPIVLATLPPKPYLLEPIDSLRGEPTFLVFSTLSSAPQTQCRVLAPSLRNVAVAKAIFIGNKLLEPPLPGALPGAIESIPYKPELREPVDAFWRELALLAQPALCADPSS